MRTSLPDDLLTSSLGKLGGIEHSNNLTGQPLHTVYGGANLFSSDTPAKLARLTRGAFETYLPDTGAVTSVFGISTRLAEEVHRKISERLRKDAIDDLRADFEDGYGSRPDAEEDGHAVAAARETAKARSENALPQYFGIRIKSLAGEARRRSLRTLDLYLTALVDAGSMLPSNFVVTLPKVTHPSQPQVLAATLDALEDRLGFEKGSIKIELMVETRRSLVADDGRFALPELVDACGGRCRGLHFGAWDYLAEFGVTAEQQHLLHPLCDTARQIMQLSAPAGIWISDGATNIMPIGPHRAGELTDEQIEENRRVIHDAWRLHFRHCRAALESGIYQGWDLHPAQIPARLASVYSFFLENIGETAERLRRFVDKAAQATLAGDVFDDEATGQGMLNHFVRAVNFGALTQAEAEALTGISMQLLSAGSFAKIISSGQSN
ncbi:MAG: phosphoenolpyruvate kinase [Acidobacteriota bacterium]|nr:MAG: phosphoenolpyruvate kinase [Acidobacteriota bacterium]